VSLHSLSSTTLGVPEVHVAASYYEDFGLSRATDRPDGGQSPLRRPTTRPGGRVLHARLEDNGVPIPSLDLASDLSFALSTGPGGEAARTATWPGDPRVTRRTARSSSPPSSIRHSAANPKHRPRATLLPTGHQRSGRDWSRNESAPVQGSRTH
jgi:hypothetical protein